MRAIEAARISALTVVSTSHLPTCWALSRATSCCSAVRSAKVVVSTSRK